MIYTTVFTPDKPTLLGIIKTNALPLGKDTEYGGIFPIICRINHSCLPNSCFYWDEKANIAKIFALKLIESGEEIMTTYIDLYADRITRSKYLKEFFNFDCKCSLCSIDNIKKIISSDKRRRKLKHLDEAIAIESLRFPNRALTKAYEMISLLNKEDMIFDACYLSKISYDIFSILYQTTRKNLNYWAKMVIINYNICQGEFDGFLKEQVYRFSNLE